MRRARRLFPALLLAIMLPAGLSGQAAPAEESDTATLVAQLASADGAVREQAAVAMRARIARGVGSSAGSGIPGTGARSRHVEVAAPEGFAGRWVTYFENGNVARDRTLNDGRPVGRSLSFHDNGAMLAEVTYDERGVLDGPQRNWNREGRLIYEANYRNGLLDGREAYWSEAGELETERFHEAGVLVDF